jgi:hypothetical protein
MSHQTAWAALCAIGLCGGCSTRKGPAVPVDAGAFQWEASLPSELPPFTVGPLESGRPDWVRRTYSGDGLALSVTVARAPSTPDAYAGWTQMSREYPQVELPLAPDAGNGFFSCGSKEETAACDLHVQLRSGFHVEVFGGSKATRAQLQAFARRLPWQQLAAAP